MCVVLRKRIYGYILRFYGLILDFLTEGNGEGRQVPSTLEHPVRSGVHYGPRSRRYGRSLCCLPTVLSL